MGKSGDLSAFDKVINLYGSVTEKVDVKNFAFGGLFSYSRCEHISKVIFGQQNGTPGTH